MAYYYSPYRTDYESQLDNTDCPFCAGENREKQSIRDLAGKVVENTHYLWLVNWYPKFEGHTMIVPKRHIESLFDETPEEVRDRHALLLRAVTAVRKLYNHEGIDIFLQTGQGSAASQKHLHWHVTPSFPTDLIRGQEKLDQFYTMDSAEERILCYPIEIRLDREELLRALAEVLR